MQIAKIQVAREEAQRFLRRADQHLAEMVLGAATSAANFPKESGAVRRASMDLTRALAEMRKP